ncbi:DUF6318 family protein [Nesterenkonia natronophila]
MTALAGCAEGTERAEAEEAQPTVLESAADKTAGRDVESSPEGGEDGPGDGAAEASDPTPVPASSEGPAQDWPAPEPPEEIYAPTEEGAEALLQYWFDARHYARITGETAPLEEVSHEDCEMCRAELELVRDVFANDGWYVSDSDVVKDIHVRLESSKIASGLFILKESKFEYYWNQEKQGISRHNKVGAYQFKFRYVGDQWRVIHSNNIEL